MVPASIATIEEAYADLEAAHARVAALDYSGLSVAEQLTLLSRREILARSAPTVDHALLAGLQDQTTPREIGAKSWADVLVMRLHISGDEARRRVREAANLGPRTALGGEALQPVYPHLAAAQAAGTISSEHVKVWDDFVKKLRTWTDAATRTSCERTLIDGAAAGQTPEEMRTAADRLAFLLDQDGPLPDDAERQRCREVHLGKQQSDGMTKISGYITPETRALIEAAHQKCAAPGMANPDDENPCVSGTPSQAQIDADTRSPGQRCHDALAHTYRQFLGSGDHGEHNGLPVTVVVTTTLQDLEHASGSALTTTGTTLPMADLITMASRGAHPYLAVFDKHTNVPLHLGRARRTASPGQRLVLFARDRGCTRPHCTQPASRCQAHHANADWQHDGRTDITELALACGPDNRLVDQNNPNAWHTAMKNGRAHWTPPPLLDTGQPRTNTYHHAQLYPEPEGKDDGETDCPAV